MAYYDNDKKRDLSAKEIVDRFGVGYYELQIEDLQKRISNIRAGKGDCSDGITYVSESSLKTPKDRERRIDQLRKKIEDYKKIIHEINEAINTINRGVYVLEKATEIQALIGGLSSDLRKCFLKYTDKDKNGERHRIPSDTYNAIFVNKMFENAKSKYRRLWSKENKNASKSTIKIKKDIYNKLKKIQNRAVVKNDKYGYVYSINGFDYDSLNGAMKENHHTLKCFAYDLYTDVGKQYNSWDVETLAPLGVEVEKVKRAYAISDGEERIFDEFGPILQSMKYLAREYSVYKRFKTFYILEEKVEEVNKLSREVECLDLIIDAYDNTALKDTDLFKELVEIYRKQNKKLQDLSRKFREMYQRSGMEEYIEIEKKLRELHQKAGTLRYQVSISEEKLGYSDPETRKLNDMYFGARAEMLSILLKYPELNKNEYGIDLTKYDKKGRYIGEEPEKKVSPETTHNNSVKEETEEQFIPTRVVTEDELKKDLGLEEDTSKKPWEAVEDTLEVPDHLTSIRTAYYSRYMVEKVKGSELGKMKFSEYLEKINPDQGELIEIEQKREQRAANVFKLYIQYLASLEDKSQAMRFSDFARLRHGLEESDLPFEYSDEEVQKRLKK